MKRTTAIALIALLSLIVLAHVGLWRSDRVAEAMKWRLTVLNAVGWAIVLVPACTVTLWLKAQQRRD